MNIFGGLKMKIVFYGKSYYNLLNEYEFCMNIDENLKNSIRDWFKSYSIVEI